MIELGPALPATILALIAWILRNMLGPQPFALPDQFAKTARAVEATADKWGEVADAVLSWHLLVAFGLGAVLAFIVVRLR